MIAPEQVVDRSEEQTVFRRIAAFEEPVRVLLVHGESNHGKTCLLRRLEYNCRTEMRPALRAVAFVDLSQLDDQQPLSFAHEVRRLLRARARVAFREFDELSRRYLGRGAIPLAGTPGMPAAGGTNAVNAPSSNIGGSATVGGTVYRAESMTFNVAGGPVALDPLAEDDLLDAFVRDLAALGAEQPVVLMVDHFDVSRRMLRELIENQLVPLCEEGGDARLLLVVAGNSVPYHGANDERIATLEVRSRLPRPEDVRDFLIVHGWEDPKPYEIDAVRDLLERGKGYDAVLTALDALRAIREV